MMVSIDDAPSGPYSPELQSKLLIWGNTSHIDGTAQNLDMALRPRILRTCKEGGLLWISLGLAGLLFFIERDELVPGIAIVLGVIGVCLLKFLALNVRWRETVERLAPEMPPPGTTVRISAHGLTVGSVTTPWDLLEIEQLDLRLVRGFRILARYGANIEKYFIDRLHIRTVNGRVVLDSALITCGQEILNSLFDRLYPLPSDD